MSVCRNIAFPLKELTMQLLKHADTLRQEISPTISQKRKAELGQFMTPSPIARYMAAMFPPVPLQICHLLDAGAGLGALASAFLDRLLSRELCFERIEAVAYEIDPALREYLEKNLARYASHLPLAAQVIEGDFIELAVKRCIEGRGNFTHAILNPPYKKIGSCSAHRRALRAIGLETVNLYAAFVALAVALMATGGHVVAIIPRSFCNGPYYRPFRNYILERAALRRIHLFNSRSQAFKDDDVLQENIIIMLERRGQQDAVTVTTSTDETFADLATHVHPFERIVFPDDPERFIHIPTSAERNAIEKSEAVRYALDEVGIKVSTGPVVDFRLKEHLCDLPNADTVPLLYPNHFDGQMIEWPKVGAKKPNAIRLNAETQRWLYPNGFYCAVRRFSSKEERRRIVASVIDPRAFPGADLLGLENHLNVFHENRRGLPEALARGLAVFLNTSAVDEHFRRFNGHTQVNATDLKMMRYPSRAALIGLGEWAMGDPALTQEAIDAQFAKMSA